MPVHLSNEPSTSQTSSLGTQRQSSTIPLSSPGKLPPHQKAGDNVWVYPSEQMFFNAMKRKASSHRQQDPVTEFLCWDSESCITPYESVSSGSAVQSNVLKHTT